jgi:Tol biopolymer transport system component
MRTKRILAAVLVAAALPAAAVAAVPDERAFRASRSAAGGDPDGASRRPDFSTSGELIVFESSASNLAADPNGAVADIFERDLNTGATRLVSAAPDGSGANGASGSATVASRTGTVVFESAATNLGPRDTNGVGDIYARAGDGPIQRVSLTSGGGEPDARSFEPDVSADGRFVVFTTAAGLVPEDINGVEDVYIRDLAAGTTAIVSKGGNGPSRAPAISPDGLFVTYTSTATTLVAGDTNEVADVFLADLKFRRTQRVSVSTSGRQQNRAVEKPFFIVSDVSRDGRYVAWDSDATNLVRGDTNRDTDVFVRDVNTQTTERVSRTLLDRQADNDSYFPSLSADGRFVGFSSYATNIWPHDRKGEDVFMHDRRLDTTTLLTAREDGTPRGAENVQQLLRRPALSVDGDRVTFTSTSSLAAGDGNDIEDVYVRETAPPDTRIISVGSGRRPRLRLSSDDPTATVFVCRLDKRLRLCPRRGRLPRLSRGRHTLKVRAGGPGTRLDPTPAVRRFRVR